MFFESWASLLRVLLSGVLSYCALVVLLRLSGKRTLSKMNAFDLVITVALGSTLATILLDNSIPIVNGVSAFGLLILLQYGITWASVRSDRIRSLVKSEPTALVLVITGDELVMLRALAAKYKLGLLPFRSWAIGPKLGQCPPSCFSIVLPGCRPFTRPAQFPP